MDVHLPSFQCSSLLPFVTANEFTVFHPLVLHEKPICCIKKLLKLCVVMESGLVKDINGKEKET